MTGMKMSIRTALQPHCRLHPRHQFSCAGLCAGARPAVPISSFAQRTTAQSTCFAAVVAPDVAEESASAQTAEHTNNRATTQQSSGASHVESCYPTKTINCSDEEWKARVDLAALYRVCHNHGMNEGINNHLTATMPGMPGHFLVFAFGLLWSEVTASNLLLMDSKGNVVRGEGHPEATAFWIHSRLHDVHPAAACVVHTHQPWTTALACLSDPTLPMIHQNSMRFYNDIAYDKEYNGLVLDEDEGNRIAKVMDGRRVHLHANHGVIIATETIGEAFDYLYYLERAAEVTIKALSTGKPLKLIDEVVCATTHEKFVDSGIAAEVRLLALVVHSALVLHNEAYRTLKAA
ncbi:TPA: hypothetical protein ACH3X3_003674 [Trebouxia sp. C0006]